MSMQPNVFLNKRYHKDIFLTMSPKYINTTKKKYSPYIIVFKLPKPYSHKHTTSLTKLVFPQNYVYRFSIFLLLFLV